MTLGFATELGADGRLASNRAQNSVRGAHLRRALISVAALGVAGCAARSSYMVEATVTSAQIQPSTETALVTFIRPSRYALLMSPAILDENAHFLGASEARSKFTVAMRPGHHVFVVWAENSDAIVADLAPGKRYFIEVSPTEGWTSARVHLIALTPHGKKWRDLDGWLERTTTLVPSAAGETYVESRKAAARDRVRRGMEHLRGYGAVDLETRTLHADDGI